MKFLFGRNHRDRTDNRSSKEYTEVQAEARQVIPDCFRWFCGLHDLNYTYVCQVL